MSLRNRIVISAVAITLGVVAAPVVVSTIATAQPTQQPAPQPPARQQPRPPRTAGDPLFDPKDTLILLLDHQTGLLQTVKDIGVDELRNNTVVLAKIAELTNTPILTTASEPNGPNGPLLPELATVAPSAKYIPRRGEVSAWDNADFRKAVKASGKRTLIIAGIWTSVCVAFPALQAKADGYTVYAVIDASGDMSDMASRAALERMAQAGIIPISTNAVMAEFQRTWARPDAARWGALYSELVPHYRAVTESYQRAQTAARKQAPAKAASR